MKNYKAYIFDLDGTLVDSEKLKGKAIASTCSLFGAHVDIKIYQNIMGESWEKVSQYFFKEGKIKPDITEFNLKFKKIYQDLLLTELKPNLNVKKYLVKLIESNKRLGVVSSASRWMVDQVMSQLELDHFFEFIITKEDVKKHKPNPEAYFLALEKLGLSSSEVLIFEDSESGLIAANRVNSDSIAFRHEFNKNHDLSLAIKIISDFGTLNDIEN